MMSLVDVSKLAPPPGDSQVPVDLEPDDEDPLDQYLNTSGPTIEEVRDDELMQPATDEEMAAQKPSQEGEEGEEEASPPPPPPAAASSSNSKQSHKADGKCCASSRLNKSGVAADMSEPIALSACRTTVLEESRAGPL